MANALQWYDKSRVISHGAAAAGICDSTPEWLTAAGNSRVLNHAELAVIGSSSDFLSTTADAGSAVTFPLSGYLEN